MVLSGLTILYVICEHAISLLQTTPHSKPFNTTITANYISTYA